MICSIFGSYQVQFDLIANGVKFLQIFIESRRWVVIINALPRRRRESYQLLAWNIYAIESLQVPIVRHVIVLNQLSGLFKRCLEIRLLVSIEYGSAD